MDVPFYEKHLRVFLTLPRSRVFFVSVDGEFSLVVWDGQRRNVLNTQRGKVRTFVDLTKAAAYVHEAGLNKVMVCMNEEALRKEIESSGTLMSFADDDDED